MLMPNTAIEIAAQPRQKLLECHKGAADGDERERAEAGENEKPVTRWNAIPLDERCSSLSLFIIPLWRWFSTVRGSVNYGQGLNVLPAKRLQRRTTNDGCAR